MYKIKIYMLLLILSLLLTGCHQIHKFTIEEYETKIEGNRIDKNVTMKYFNKQQEGQLEIEFEEKSIPFEFKLIGETQTFGGTYRLSGSFEEGEIAVMLLLPDGTVDWKNVFKPGKLKVEKTFDAYSGDYILRIEFNNAKKGKLMFEGVIY